MIQSGNFFRQIEQRWHTYTERWVGKRASKVNENFEMKRISIVEREAKFVC